MINYKSKLISLFFLIMIIIMALLPSLDSVKSSDNRSTTIYILLMFTIFSTLISIGLAYLVYFLLFNFIVQRKISSKTIILNFVLAITFSNVLFKIICIYFFKINSELTNFVNPFMLIFGYAFYRYMSYRESLDKRKVLYFLLSSYSFITIGSYLLNYVKNI